MGRWACFGLRGLRYRASKGKRWSLERAGMEGAKHGFSWWGMGRVGYRMSSLGGKWLNVRWLHKCARMAYLDAGRGAVGKTV